MKQRDVFAQVEGNRYFERNREAQLALQLHPEADPVVAMFARIEPEPRTVLEIGASDGWRLAALKQGRPQLKGYGIDPADSAIAEGQDRYPDIELRSGTAESLPYDAAMFDVIIFGFCLYLCDRGDLFQIASEADRVLAPQGHLIVYDFFQDGARDTPTRKPYAHREGVYCYKMDHASMFTWNPDYHRVAQDILTHPGGDRNNRADCVAVTLLKHDTCSAYVDVS